MPTDELVHQKFLNSPPAILSPESRPLYTTLTCRGTRVHADAIDVDLAVLQMARHLQRSLHIRGPDRCIQPVGRAVSESNGLFIRADDVE